MVGDYGLRPTSLCFRYLLQTAAHCHPPKWEEALSILRKMERDWNITPNAAHFATVIHAVATRWAMVESPMSQDVMVQMDSGHHFEVYKKRLLHGALFENLSKTQSVSDSDLQRVLDLFHEMTDEMGIVPNDRVFAELFYACDKARNLEMALRIRAFWKRQFPMIRQQALSLHKLIAICSTLCSWDDALSIYKSSVFVLESNDDHDPDDDALYSFDGDTLALSAAHKVQPEIGVLNQMLRCSMKDVSRQILDQELSEEEAVGVISERVHFVENEMMKFQFAPNDMTWAFLFQTAAIVNSKALCDRFLKRFFQFQRKQNQRSYRVDLERDSSSDCWDIYDCDSIEIRPVVRNAMMSALYWTDQMDKAMRVYHDYYAVKQRFTHWFAPKNEPERLMLDFHGFDPAVAVVALRYVFENEFENVFARLLRVDDDGDSLRTDKRLSLWLDDGEQIEGQLEGDIMVDDDDGEHDDDDIGFDHKFDSEKLEMTVPLCSGNDIDEKQRGRNLMIVTGRGKGNEKGISVLRPWLKLWLQSEADPPIRSHIHPRNVGILVVDSSDVLNHIAANKQKSNEFNDENLDKLI